MSTLANLLPTTVLTVLFVAAMLGAATTTEARPRHRVVVVKRPAPARVVVVSRPAPGPRRVWVPGYWKQLGPRRAIWIEGYWRPR